MKLKGEFFEKIKSGEKLYEIRLNDEKRQGLDVGDVIIFGKEPELAEKLFVEVKDLIYFESFEETLSTLPMEKVGFSELSIAQALELYYRIYDRSDEKKYGVVAIKLSVLKG